MDVVITPEIQKALNSKACQDLKKQKVELNLQETKDFLEKTGAFTHSILSSKDKPAMDKLTALFSYCLATGAGTDETYGCSTPQIASIFYFIGARVPCDIDAFNHAISSCTVSTMRVDETVSVSKALSKQTMDINSQVSMQDTTYEDLIVKINTACQLGDSDSRTIVQPLYKTFQSEMDPASPKYDATLARTSLAWAMIYTAGCGYMSDSQGADLSPQECNEDNYPKIVHFMSDLVAKCNGYSECLNLDHTNFASNSDGYAIVFMAGRLRLNEEKCAEQRLVQHYDNKPKVAQITNAYDESRVDVPKEIEEVCGIDICKAIAACKYDICDIHDSSTWLLQYASGCEGYTQVTAEHTEL